MDTLQQAVAVAEQGDAKQAYVILARFLKDQPNSVAGWLTLSSLVDDPARKRTFLERVLALDPANGEADAMLAALTPEMSAQQDVPAAPEPAAPVTADQPPSDSTGGSGKSDFETQAKGETVPPWLENDPNVLSDVDPPPVAETSADGATAPEQVAGAAPDAVPDWLKEDAAAADWPAAQPADATPAPQPAGIQLDRTPAPVAAKSSGRSSDALLWLLAIFIMLLILALAFVALR